MKSFIIGENDSGQRLDKFITKAVPSLPQTLMYKYIRLKRIKVNGKRSEISSRLNKDDLVEMYINDEFFTPVKSVYDFMTASKKLNIIYEDDNIMLLDKPVGLLSHPDVTEYNDTLITRVKRYLYESGFYNPDDENSFAPSLVNRIDRNTSGIVIAAKNAESLRILNEKLKKREIEKYYLCVIHGVLDEKQGILEGWLIKDEDKNKVAVFNSPRDGSKEIRTKYSVLGEQNGLSLVEVQLLTGRTHQIRAHFACIGHPLLGDGKYGTNTANKPYGYKKQFLSSYRLCFAFKSDAGILNYLNGKSFSLSDVWFRSEFLQGRLTRK